MVNVGKSVPDFDLPATGDKNLSKKDLLGSKLVLYFYPRDSTPGCTREGQDFRDQHGEFQSLDTQIIGVSQDSIRKHENFRSKQNFPFDLVSDEKGDLCQAFGVIKEKNMYGRKFMGIERSTFLIDEKGVLRREWRKVQVPGHVDEVLEAVRDLS